MGHLITELEDEVGVAVALVRLTDLAPYDRNARTHPQDQIEEIKASIRAFGFTSPILADLDDGGVIAAGHGRHMALEQMLEAEEEIRLPNGKVLPAGYVPVIDCSAWTEAQRRAYTLADNKIAANSGWDDELLKIEIGDLLDLADEDAPVLGFSDKELRAFARALDGIEGTEERTPEPPVDPVSRPGDLWVLGDHRLLCGDSTRADDVERLLDGALPHLMVTDPPYGVDYDPAWRNGAGASQTKRTGKVLNDDRADWRETWALFPGDVAYVWHGALHATTVAESLSANGFEVRSQIVWVKDRLVLSRGHYHWRHEPCFYAVRTGGKGHWSGDHAQTTVWEIPNRDQDSDTVHGTQKPVECMRRPIANNSVEGDTIYEPFSGSGTTIIAGEIEARWVYAMELSPAYVDVAVMRWQDFTGKTAVLLDDGRTFAEVKEARTDG